MGRKPPFFEEVDLDEEIPSLTKGPITRTQLVKYAGASGDFNPMHHDEVYAKQAGMPSVFAHGMLSMGFMAQLITDWVGNEPLRKLWVRFQAITWPGDTITCKGKVTKKYQEGGKNYVECDIWAENQKGEKTTTGKALLDLPSKGKKVSLSFR